MFIQRRFKGNEVSLWPDFRQIQAVLIGEILQSDDGQFHDEYRTSTKGIL
jgi:hypothetical protein